MSVAERHRTNVSNAALRDYHDRFAVAYDTFYQKRDVEGEVTRALELLAPTGDPGHARMLDFGCGTGSHALAMAARGYRVLGFDASSAMIAQARKKTPVAHDGLAEFVCSDGSVERLRYLGEAVDGVVSFFNVLNCASSSAEIVDCLVAIRGAMQKGARGYFEVWNGAAVFSDAPRPDVRHFRVDDGTREMIRITVPEICRIEQRCTLRYRVLELDAACGSYTEFESEHRLHFLTPVQYRHLFALAGLTVEDEFPKQRPGTPVTASDWYIAYLVRRD